MESKIYSNVNLNGNYLTNLSIEVVSSEDVDIESLQTGRMYFDSVKKQFVGFQGNELQNFNTSNTYSTIRINTVDEGYTDLAARNQKDIISFKEGYGVNLSVDEENNEVTVSADLNYSSNNFSTIIGNEENVSYTVEHGLGSYAVIPQVVVLPNSNVSSNFTVLRYNVIDEDSVEVELSEAPGIDALRLNVTSKLGQRGEVGVQGDTGPQGLVGPQGYQGIDGTTALIFTPGDSGKVLYSNSSGYPAASNVMSISHSASSNSAIVSTSNNSYGVKVIHNSSNANSNIVHIVIENATELSPNEDNTAILIETDFNNVTDEIFSVGIDGALKSKSLSNSGAYFSYLTSVTPEGKLERTDISTERFGDILKKKITISSSQILNSYTTPITVIEARGGYTINLLSVFGKYNYGTVSYDWPEAAVIVAAGPPLPLVEINSGLLNGTVSAYFNYSVNVYDQPGAQAFDNGIPLVFKTLIANPTNGNGTLTLELTYKLVDF